MRHTIANRLGNKASPASVAIKHFGSSFVPAPAPYAERFLKVAIRAAGRPPAKESLPYQGILDAAVTIPR